MIYEEPMMEIVLLEANDIFTLTNSGDEINNGTDVDYGEWSNL